MGTHSLGRSERLSGRSAVQELFKQGASFYVHPFRVIVLIGLGAQKHRALFSVSKKNFKKGVERNLLKRRMREAYRLNKHTLPGSTKLQIAYIYSANKILGFEEIREKLIEANKRLLQYVEKS
jgi:ribonuclease P protein component